MRISAFAPVGTLDHQTGILNAIRTFARDGFEVDVYAVRNIRYGEARFDSPRVHVRYLPWTFDSEREPRTLVTLLFTLWILCAPWRRHHVIYAGGVRGLIAAWAYSLVCRTRIVNYQTELYVGGAVSGVAGRLFKWIERKAVRRSDVTVEHSDERKALLVEDSGVDPVRVVVVPNSPPGPAARRRSVLLHERLGLSREIRLLVCPGSISEEFCSTALVEAAEYLPDGWVCVIHSVHPRDPDDAYIRGLKSLSGAARVRFSLDPVPYERIDELMGSADLGIALYSAEAGPNMSFIGLSSGKVSHFLKVGVPVLVSDSPGLSDFILATGAGEVVSDLRALGRVVERMQSHWHEYSQRSLEAFDRCLSFERNFSPVIDLCRIWATEA